MDNFKSHFQKLNSISSENFSSIGNINFYYGNYTSQLKEVLSKIIPFGKALLLCSETFFEQEGNALLFELKDANINIISIAENSIDEQDILESIPDDVRAIVALENDYYNLSLSIATKLNLFFVCVVKTFNFSNVLSYSQSQIENGKMKKVIFDADTHIIFDVDKILLDEKNVSNEFAFIMSKLVSLIDYRIYGLVTECPTNKSAYSLIKNAVEETYSIFSFDRQEFLMLIIKNSILIRLANIISKGKVFENSSVDICKRVTGDRTALIPLARKIVKIYTLCFSSQFDGVSEPNYLDRVEQILPLDCVLESQVGEWIIKQSKMVLEKQETIKQIKQNLKTEIFEYNKIFSKVEKTYLALGGSLGKVDDSVVKLSGDFFEVFNGMTLVRESGIAEFI